MKELIIYLQSDLKRIRNNISPKSFLIAFSFNHSFKYMFWFRLGTYCKQYSYFPLFYFLCSWVLKRLSIKYGIQMPCGTHVGKGLCFAHFSSIVISGDSAIGNHVTIFNGATIGTERGGDMAGAPTIGNNTVIATGAKIIGNVHVGNNVFIGANAVVVKDVPDCAVVGGIPAKILNMNGIEKTSFY